MPNGSSRRSSFPLLFIVHELSVRVLSRDINVCGYAIPSGTTCWVPFYPIFRDPKLWKDPESFLPERWEESTHATKFFPFSNGPRNCTSTLLVNTFHLTPFLQGIGIALAQQELKVALAAVVKSFDFKLQDGFQVVPVQHITLNYRGRVSF